MLVSVPEKGRILKNGFKFMSCAQFFDKNEVCIFSQFCCTSKLWNKIANTKRFVLFIFDGKFDLLNIGKYV